MQPVTSEDGIAVRRYYRFRGSVNGVERAFHLAPGENRLGSSETNDLVIGVRGVSREHAKVLIGPDGVEVEDLESKNGTFVNKARTDRAEVQPGDRIRFGPVSFVLEEADPGDAALAVILETPAPSTQFTPTPEESTYVILDELRRDKSHHAMLLVEGFLHNLSQQGDFRSALAFLDGRLAASGASLLEGSGPTGSVSLASHGTIGELSEHGELWDEQNRAMKQARNERCCLSGESSAPPTLSYAILAAPGSEPLSLVLWGTGSEPSEERLGLLRVLVRIIDRVRSIPHPTRVSSRAVVPGLVFPENYVPGESPAIRAAYQSLQPIVRSDLPALIEGETGTGKEWMARIIHVSSSRSDGPFVPINCAAIPRDLLEAELFGIKEGVATGVRERTGKLQSADGGTLFLDEIGEMPPELQAKLLRALQEKEVTPLGGSLVSIDIRVVAATNSELSKLVEQKSFRNDLYYRVAGAVVRVPPLRERRGDIALLIEHFLIKFSEEAEKPIRGVTVKALQHLRDYSWPGNIRELEHEVGRLVHICPRGQAIDSTLLPERILAYSANPLTGSAPPTSLKLEEHVHAVERRMILLALERSGGSQRKASQLLGISRNALARKIQRLDIQL